MATRLISIKVATVVFPSLPFSRQSSEMKKPNRPKLPQLEPIASSFRSPRTNAQPTVRHPRSHLAFAHQLMRLGVFNLGFFLLAFRPLPKTLVTQSRPPDPIPIAVEAPLANSKLTQYTQTSLDRLTQLEANIEDNLVPPDILHYPPDSFRGQTVRDLLLPTQERAIALTFDDGPSEYTLQILDILKKHQIRATFFVLGQTIPGREAILQRVVNEGHVLGNHSWSHPYNYHDRFAAIQEIDRTDNIIHQHTRVRSRYFRPPGGYLNNGLADYAASREYSVAMWSVDSFDYLVSTAAIVTNVVNGAHPGAIVLLHDGGGNRSRTVAALPQIISQLQAQGYRFVTLSELMELSQTPPLEKPITPP